MCGTLSSLCGSFRPASIPSLRVPLRGRDTRATSRPALPPLGEQRPAPPAPSPAGPPGSAGAEVRVGEQGCAPARGCPRCHLCVAGGADGRERVYRGSNKKNQHPFTSSLLNPATFQCHTQVRFFCFSVLPETYKVCCCCCCCC